MEGRPGVGLECQEREIERVQVTGMPVVAPSQREPVLAHGDVPEQSPGDEIVWLASKRLTERCLRFRGSVKAARLSP